MALILAAIGTGLIIAIVVTALVLLALLALIPRLRGTRERNRLEHRRNEVAEQHRGEAENLRLRSELAEREAERDRVEADLLEKRAALHERGLADEELRSDPAVNDRERPVGDPR